MSVIIPIPGSFPRDTEITKRTHFLLLIVKSAEVSPKSLLDHTKATLALTDLLANFMDGTDLVGLGGLQVSDLTIADIGTVSPRSRLTRPERFWPYFKVSRGTCSIAATSRVLLES